MGESEQDWNQRRKYLWWNWFSRSRKEADVGRWLSIKNGVEAHQADPEKPMYIIMIYIRWSSMSSGWLKKWICMRDRPRVIRRYLQIVRGYGGQFLIFQFRHRFQFDSRNAFISILFVEIWTFDVTQLSADSCLRTSDNPERPRRERNMDNPLGVKASNNIFATRPRRSDRW
jgi:hypothetical protein